VLRQRISEIRKNESGFTLIELLIVIIILGVLAGVVVLAVSGINDRGETAACKSDVKAVEVAAEAYYAKNTEYPHATGTTASATNIKTLVDAGYLHSAPNSDKYAVTYTWVPKGTVVAPAPATTVDAFKVEGFKKDSAGAVTATLCSA
jgi:prepilin-type N-terminal cleavage/methylation domain-containing protein